MSKKNRIILGITAAVLVLAILLPTVFVLTGGTHGSQIDGELTGNETSTAESDGMIDEWTSASDIPPVEIPDNSDDEAVRDDVILDVRDKERNPNPEVVDAAVEYETKGGRNDAE